MASRVHVAGNALAWKAPTVHVRSVVAFADAVQCSSEFAQLWRQALAIELRLYGVVILSCNLLVQW